MIKYSTTYIIMAIVSAVLGYSDSIGAASIIAKGIFFVFVALYIGCLLRVGVSRH